MVPKFQQPVALHQCLFGYDAGHRMLGSSIPLPDEVASTLLLLSDLAPGQVLSNSDGYWTGIPLPSVKLYALMHTWPAPEMPRPGCVWTRTLLINFSDLARFQDLCVLLKLVTRPQISELFEKLSKPITMELDQILEPVTGSRRSFSRNEALRVLKSLYGSPKERQISLPINDPEELIFSAWSQQWPRLRRSFSFRTAIFSENSPLIGYKFGIRIVASQSSERESGIKGSDISPEPWEEVAVEDLLCVQPTPFRRFLWRYGSDIRNGQERYNLLGRLFTSIHNHQFSGRQRDAVFSEVSRVFPLQADGRVIKSDLIAIEENPYSHFPPADPIEVLNYSVRHPEMQSFFEASFSKVIESVRQSWPNRTEEIISLADFSLEANSSLSMILVPWLAHTLSPVSFLTGTLGHSSLRRQLVIENAELLDTSDLSTVPGPELAALIQLIPPNKPVLPRLIRHLLPLDDGTISNLMLDRCSGSAFLSIVEEIDQNDREGSPLISESWQRALHQRSGEFIASRAIERIASTRTLATIASILGYDTSTVLSAGGTQWVSALSQAVDNVEGSQRQLLLAFLLVLFLHKPESGSELMIEFAFEEIHSDLWSIRLSSKATELLLPYMPSVSKKKQWDICHRLRLGVARAYLENDLDPVSFRRLCSKTKTPDLLIDLVKGIKGGDWYLERAFGHY